MSNFNRTGAGRLLTLGLAVIAAAAGIYWLQGAERKASTPGGISDPTTGISRALATGALAAFLVKPERPQLPDFAFLNSEGQEVRLSSWKGRVVLVNLWATWCAPCRKEMPTLAALQGKLGSKDFEVLAISLDRKGLAASSAFLKETGAEQLKLYVEPTARLLNDLQALGLPATVLVDRQGREIGRLLGPAQWDSPEAQKLIKAAIAEAAAQS
jgi:thiol-disulfide isomerase/thioredoxin